jgi:hypothetical protein
MVMSTITVAGINPALPILGANQEFIFGQNTSSFRLTNTFAPTISIDSITNLETRNESLSGFRWIHTTSSTDTYGTYKLQGFVDAETTGIDVFDISFVADVWQVDMSTANLLVATPTDDASAANKEYVDTAIGTATKAYCSIIMAANATATTVTTAGTYYKVAGTTSTVLASSFSSSSSPANRMVCSNSVTTKYAVNVTLNAIQNDAAGADISFMLFKNGSAITSFCAPITAKFANNTDTISMALNTIIELANTDYLELYVTASENTTDVTVANLNFTAVAT